METFTDIIKYPNRRLYCMNTGTYTNLRAVEKMVRDGHSVSVWCKRTGKDITAHVLLRIVATGRAFDVELLHEIIRKGPDALALVAGTKKIDGEATVRTTDEGDSQSC
jgi:polyhydroxyalkanoate synthesis regulator protein